MCKYFDNLTIFSSYHHDENKAHRDRIEYLEDKSSCCFFGIYFRIFENKNFFGIFAPDSGSAIFFIIFDFAQTNRSRALSRAGVATISIFSLQVFLENL